MIISDFPDEFLDEHKDWHMPGNDGSRENDPGNWPAGGGRAVGAGLEFLLFHRRYLWKVYDWFQSETGGIPSYLDAWAAIPQEVKLQINPPSFLGAGQQNWWRQRSDGSSYSDLQDTENQLTLGKPFSSSNAIGNLIEANSDVTWGNYPIHGWVHAAAAQAYEEPIFADIDNSPVSTFFYNWHGLIDSWWKEWQRGINSAKIEGQVILFENVNFHGQHKHIFGPETNLNASDDNFFNDKTSSFVIISGNWSFCGARDFGIPFGQVLGPGLYANVGDIGMRNDWLSSLQPVNSLPEIIGDPLQYHALLFEHVNFRGQHKHVFVAEPNLNAGDDNFFNDRTSSIVVLRGRWSAFKDKDYNNPLGIPLGLGLYPDVRSVGIENDAISSLQPGNGTEYIMGAPVNGHVLLFMAKNYHGLHKHVFNIELNLNASNDNGFNDKTSSIVIISGRWVFYRNADCEDPNPTTLTGPMRYAWVEEVGIQNDTISSLVSTAVPLPPSEGGIEGGIN